MDTGKPRLPNVAGYKTEAVLGEGGMATVYLAVQESLSRHVALKIMARILITDADFRRRFLNEGRLIAKLSHPNIVTVYDIGVSDSIHYLSMTYLPGGTLKEKIREGLPLDRAILVLKCLAGALGYAHSQGIVHRDIKPGNVLFTHSGEPVLTDFGIAKTVGSETQLTSTGMTVGSAGYMSPEQALGLRVDNRSDLYSLGVLFWEMLTGGLPYSAQDPFSLALKHAKDPIPELPGNRHRFQPVVEGLLAKKPEERLASAEKLVRVIDEIPYDDIRASAPSDPDTTIVLPRSPKHRPSHPNVVTEADAQPASAPKRRLVLLAALTAIAGLAGIAGYFGYIGSLSPPPDALPSSPPVATGSVPQEESVPGPPAGVPESGDEQSADATPAADEQRDERQSIEALLRQGEGQWNAYRLIEPVGDNAFETYSKVLDLDPEHAEAKQKLVQIGRISAANKMFLAAESLLRDGEIDAARRMIETGLRMNPDDERLSGLKRALD